MYGPTMASPRRTRLLPRHPQAEVAAPPHIARAFGNEEFLEPAEEALVRRCTLVDTYYNFTNAATKESDNDSAFGTVRIEEADSMMDQIDSIG